MQTDVTSSQLVAAVTPVSKVSLPNPPPEGKESFDFHIELIIQNETSEELMDVIVNETAGESSGEESELTIISETEATPAEGLAIDQSVDRDIVGADGRDLLKETLAFAIPPTRAVEVEFTKTEDSAQLSDINGKTVDPTAVRPERQEAPPLESTKAEQPSQIIAVATQTGISPAYKRGFVTRDDGQAEDSFAGNVRQVQKNVVSELPNNDGIPKMFDKGTANSPVQPTINGSQQLISEPRTPLKGGTINVPGLALAEPGPNATKAPGQFQALESTQLDMAGSTPVLSISKVGQLSTTRGAIPNTMGPSQKPDVSVEPPRGQIFTQTSTPNTVAQVLPNRPDFTGTKTDPQILAGFRPSQTGTAETAAIIPASSPDTAGNTPSNTVSPPSLRSSAGFSVDQKMGVLASDQRWGNSTTSLAIQPNSTPASSPEFVGNVANGAISKSLDVQTKTFFLDEGRTDDIPVLSRESLTPNAPVRSAENVFTHPSTARAVASQMADALSNAQSKKIEIALNPEELGRVRMVLSTSDAGISVSILAERPETLDLMRRHIDQLTEEFRNLGYVDIGFDFSGDGTNSRFDEGSEGRQGFTEMEPDNNSADVPVGSETDNSTRPPVLRGLDMRL
ncbi:MAG: hypothetical protein COC12_02400 [Rhodobacteraceae bacterium]|nr:MAG: hypothetical protein COC12_02400 [Paracoccaceae bacterium]